MAEGPQSGENGHETSVRACQFVTRCSRTAATARDAGSQGSCGALPIISSMMQLHSTSLLLAASASLAIASVAAAAIGVRQAPAPRRLVVDRRQPGPGRGPRGACARGPDRPARTDRRRARPAMAGGHAGRHARATSPAAEARPGLGRRRRPRPLPAPRGRRLVSADERRRPRPGSWSAPCSARPSMPRWPSGAWRTSRPHRSCTACSSP